MKGREPRDDTLAYTDRTRTQARLKRGYLRGDVHGILVVMVLAAFVTGLGILLLWLVE
jgi:hypothetical protein